MIELSVANLGVHCAQILVVVALAAAAARLLDIPAPRVRLAYWRAVVVLCLALPFFALAQPAAPIALTIPSRPVSLLADAIAGTAPAALEPARNLPLAPLVLALLLAGIGIRGAWLVIGYARLQRIRREAPLADLGEDVERLRAAIAPRAEVRRCNTVCQPATFGCWRPVILLPDSSTAMPTAERLAIVCHELIHVRRRDWVWTIAEESLRTVFWFHPAMRYAISRVQASREEVVDAEVIKRLGARHEYMRALVTFAEEPELRSATAFVHRSELKTRLRRISEEVHVPRLRLQLLASTLCCALAAAVAAAGAGVRYDLTAQAQGASAPSDAVQFSVPLSRAIVRLDSPVYPPEAWQAGIGAELSMRLRVAANGLVTIEGNPEWRITVTNASPTEAVQSFWTQQGWRRFIDAASDAVGQWQYVPADSDVMVMARVTFQPSPSAASRDRLVRQDLIDALQRIDPSGQSSYVLVSLENPYVVVRGLQDVRGQAPLRVGGDVTPPQKVFGFPPVYPEAARTARVQGAVTVEVLLGEDGAVRDARVLRSIPLLDEAAIDSVRTWVFSPTIVNGVARELITTVTVNFSLPE